MDFNQLMARMRELDQPTNEGGCGMDAPMAPPMSSPMSMPKPDTPPPSMSINLNAQGMDNIESLMKLVTKVNPDMDKPNLPPLPSMGAEPSIMSIKPSMPTLKMLSDLDSEEGPEIKGLDQDKDGDHDMDDHDMEKKDKEEGNAYGMAVQNTPPGEEIKINGKGTGDIKKGDKEEAFGNSVADSEPTYKTIDDIMNKGDDLNRPKKSFSGKPYRGDNPMAAGAYESKEQLRAGIRAELMQRLAEAKGAK